MVKEGPSVRPDNNQEPANEPQTIEEAQGAINQILEELHTHRRLMNDGNEAILYTPYAEAYDKFKAALGNLPADVACVSIRGSFPHVTTDTRKDYPGYTGSALLRLQEQLSMAGVTPESTDASNQNQVQFELVVQPNYIPDELKKLTHGSYKRSLENDVFESMECRGDWGHGSLSVKPYGAPRGMAGIWALDAQPYNVPINYLTDIVLNRERKPLSPYLEGRNIDKARVVPVDYQRS